MKATYYFLRLIPSFALAAAVGMPLTATADEHDKDNKDRQSAQADNGDENQETRQLQVFDLEHRDPQQLDQIISLAEGVWAQGMAQQATAGGQATLGTAASGRVTLGYRGTADRKVVTAVNAEEKILFVRGSEDQIEKVKELVDAFDVKDGELKSHAYRDVKLLPVQSSDVQQVQSTLAQLQLQGKVLNMGGVSLVAFRGDDANKEKVQQAEEVIKSLSARPQDAEGDSGGSKGEKDKQDDNN